MKGTLLRVFSAMIIVVLVVTVVLTDNYAQKLIMGDTTAKAEILQEDKAAAIEADKQKLIQEEQQKNLQRPWNWKAFIRPSET